MKGNLSIRKTSHFLSVDSTKIPPNFRETLLDLNFDSELKFENHLFLTCNKVNRIINEFGLNINYMSINSELNYCLVKWIFHSKNVNNEI